MATAYLEVLTEDEAVRRIGPEYKGYGHDVAVFGDGSEEIGIAYRHEKVESDVCRYCHQNPIFLPTGRCSGLRIKKVDGIHMVIAEAPKTLFTRRNGIARCRTGE